MKIGHRRQIGIASGLVLGVAAVIWLSAAGCEQLHAPGPMNTGHGELSCESCHREAPGTLRQQLQNFARHALGLEATDTDVGYREVTSVECLACHERPDDRHPVFRFLEPRFAEVRDELGPEQCSTCHREHHGVRVTVPETTYCRHCHAETTVKGDPLDVSHRELVAARRWDTCLGCHDFHGNHTMKAPRRLHEAIPVERIRVYFDGGPSPYAEPIRRATRTEITP
jgi:hypothetical protein